MKQIEGRFLREAAAARLSDHPGIVTAHDAGILPDDRPYLIMDLCSGGSLTNGSSLRTGPAKSGFDKLASGSPMHWPLFTPVGVLHRDVEPGQHPDRQLR